MILKSDKPNELADPLKENILPKFAIKLGITHHSPTQATLPDGAWLFKYLFLTQEQRRALPANAQMKAGVAVNNIYRNFMQILFGTLVHKESCNLIKIF